MSVPRELNFSLPQPLKGITSEELRCPTYSTLTQLKAGSNLEIVIPQIPDSFVDPSTICLSMSCTIRQFYSMDNKTANVTNPHLDMLFGKGGGFNFIRRLITYFNNSVPIDDIDMINVLAHWTNVLSINSSDSMSHDAMIGSSSAESFAYSTAPNAVGIQIGAGILKSGTFTVTTTPAGYVDTEFTCNLPLPGFLGLGSSGKLIPLFAGPHRLTFVLEDLNNISHVTTETTGKAQCTGMSLIVNRAELVMTRVAVESTLLRQILDDLPQKGVIQVRANTYSSTSINLPEGTSGNIDLPIGIRVSSAKMLQSTFSSEKAAGRIFSGINPGANNMSYFVNGTNYPNNRADFMNSPNDQLYRQSVALGVYSTTDNKGSMPAYPFYASLVDSKPSSLFHKYTTQPMDYSSTGLGYIPNNFIFLQDIEKFGTKGSGGGFLSGANLTTGAVYLKLSLCAPTSDPLLCTTFVMHDLVASYFYDQQKMEIVR